MSTAIAYQQKNSRLKPLRTDVVLCGDCAGVLPSIPAASVDAVITSPPYYRQRDYGGSGIGNESSVEEYIEALLDTFAEVLRITKPTGNILYNLGDKYLKSGLLLVPYRFALAVTAKFPVLLVNDITWVKRNPTPRQFKRRLVSSTESFFHFVKSDQYYYARDEFMNDSDERQLPLRFSKNAKPGARLGQKYRLLLEDSSLTSAQKKRALLALEEVIEEVKSGKLESFRMKIRGIHAPAFGGQDGGRKIQMERHGFTIIRINGEKMKRDVIETAVGGSNGSGHSAIYPLPMIRELVRLLSPPGGIVLDPYAGSGTTLVAARRESRNFIGVEINPRYCKYAEQWLAEDV